MHSTRARPGDTTPHHFTTRWSAFAAAALLGACGGSDDDAPAAPPQLSAATPGTLQACSALAASFTHDSTRLTAAETVPAGTLTVAGQPIGEHCRVTGLMHERTGVNGNYAIGFEVRLPTQWNGRFFYQANGGTVGQVFTALGGQSGGGGLTNALKMGFAVLSSFIFRDVGNERGGGRLWACGRRPPRWATR